MLYLCTIHILYFMFKVDVCGMWLQHLLFVIVYNMCCLLLFTDHLEENEKLWFIHYYCKITSVTLSDNKECLVPPSAPVSLLSVCVFVLLVISDSDSINDDHYTHTRCPVYHCPLLLMIWSVS